MAEPTNRSNHYTVREHIANRRDFSFITLLSSSAMAFEKGCLRKVLYVSLGICASDQFLLGLHPRNSKYCLFAVGIYGS